MSTLDPIPMADWVKSAGWLSLGHMLTPSQHLASGVSKPRGQRVLRKMFWKESQTELTGEKKICAVKAKLSDVTREGLEWSDGS